MSKKNPTSTDKLLLRLGHEPTVLHFGGHPKSDDAPINARFVRGGTNQDSKWVEQDWISLARKLLKSEWRQRILIDAGLDTYMVCTQDAWGLVRELRQDDGTILSFVAKAVAAKQEEFQAEGRKNQPPAPAIPTFASLERRKAEREKREALRQEQLDYHIKLVKVIRSKARAIYKQERKLYTGRVERARQRKKEWLRPLMMEAIKGMNLYPNNFARKMDYYRRAKDTVCFDCGVQKDPHRMTYDHLRDKHFTLGGLRKRKNIGWRRLHLEVGKCDVVCRSCHDIREYFRGLWPWENLNIAQQKHVKEMCYVERQVFCGVINREGNHTKGVDVESLRRVKAYWQRLVERLLPTAEKQVS
jgi:hypothetical protein